MNHITFIVFPVIFVIIALIFLWVFLRKIVKKNKVEYKDYSLLVWQEYKCLNCREIMEQGFAFTGKGIIWALKNKKKPGAFSNIGQVLENTLSMSFRPALNMAWHCNNCKLIVIDHSRLLKDKKSNN